MTASPGIRFEIEVRFGVMHFEPPQYRIVAQAVKSWWRSRTEFWIESEFMRLGPFGDRGEAEATRRLMQLTK